MAIEKTTPQLTLGPVLFNWQPEAWRDFYFRIADEAPVDTVYLGEVVCSKRSPLFEPHIEAVSSRLAAAGKKLVFSTLSEVMLKADRQLIASVCALSDAMIEANDASALPSLQGRPHAIGPFMNAYNEETLEFLAGGGATNFCLPPELPAPVISVLCEHAAGLASKMPANPGIRIEVQVFGRMSLALSARCYHARAHGRTKDSCQFVCEKDADGMELRTQNDKPFLVINGIQTLSYDYLNLINELPELRAMGVSGFRLSPHTCDMVKVAGIFRAVLDDDIGAAEGAARLDAMNLQAPFSNGFYYRKPGYARIAAAQSSATL